MNTQGDQHRAAFASSYSFPPYNASSHTPTPLSANEHLKSRHSSTPTCANVYERLPFPCSDEAFSTRTNVAGALNDPYSCFVRCGVNSLCHSRPCQWLGWKPPLNLFPPEFHPLSPAHGNFFLGSRMNMLLKESQGLTYPSTNFRAPFAPVPCRPPDFQIPLPSLQCSPVQIQPLNRQCTNNSEPQAKEQSRENRLDTKAATREFVQAEESKVSHHKTKAAKVTPTPKFKVQEERQAKRKAFRQISSHLKKTPQSVNVVCKELITGRAYEVRNVYKSIIRHIHNYTKSNKAALRDHLRVLGYTPEQINSSFDTIQKYKNPNKPKEIERNSQVRVEEMLKVKSPLTHILKKVLKFMLDKWERGRVGQLATENLNVYYETCKKFLERVGRIVKIEH